MHAVPAVTTFAHAMPAVKIEFEIVVGAVFVRDILLHVSAQLQASLLVHIVEPFYLCKT